MRKFLAAILALIITIPAGIASAEDDISVYYNGKQIVFSEKNIVMNQRTLVQLRPIAAALGLGIEYDFATKNVILSNEDAVVMFRLSSNIVNINGTEITMDVPLIAYNNYTFVPIRNLVEPFGNEIIYNEQTKTITITTKETTTQEVTGESSAFDTTPHNNVPYDTIYNEVTNNPSTEAVSGKKSVFFYQSQPDLGLENNGRGYCWVCSYAMLFSNHSQTVISPLDIAAYNIESGYNGNYMAPQKGLANKFGFELVPALSEQSQYYGGFDLKGRGETSLIITSDEDVKAALREALDNFPNGVIVRYEGYPHSMIAVDYDGENIYFNDPAMGSGEHVPFEKTCLKNFTLSDISFIQAIKIK